jgi:long-chain acyl-CoA synthetase
VPGAQPTAAQLIAHARDGLAHYKCPTSVDFADTLPRTTTGKVRLFDLARLVESHLDR